MKRLPVTLRSLAVLCFIAGFAGSACADADACPDAVQELANHVIYAGLIVETGTAGIEPVYEYHIAAGQAAADRVRTECSLDEPGVTPLLNTFDLVKRGESIPHPTTPHSITP